MPLCPGKPVLAPDGLRRGSDLPVPGPSQLSEARFNGIEHRAEKCTRFSVHNDAPALGGHRAEKCTRFSASHDGPVQGAFLTASPDLSKTWSAAPDRLAANGSSGSAMTSPGAR